MPGVQRGASSLRRTGSPSVNGPYDGPWIIMLPLIVARGAGHQDDTRFQSVVPRARAICLASLHHTSPGLYLCTASMWRGSHSFSERTGWAILLWRRGGLRLRLPQALRRTGPGPAEPEILYAARSSTSPTSRAQACFYRFLSGSSWEIDEASERLRGLSRLNGVCRDQPKPYR
jgi:hypothetical protein